VLSFAAAAIVAASLPFSALYINALNKHSTAMTTSRIVHTAARPGRSVPMALTTRTSGNVATNVVVHPAAGSSTLIAPTAASTRAS
jgi:hypothetical protein